MEKSSKTSRVAAWVLVTANLIGVLLCVITTSFGLWCIAAPYSLATALDALGRPALRMLLTPEVLTVQLGVGLVIVSCFVFFISFMGLQGAVTRSSFMLFMYPTLILLLLLLECALFYYSTSNLIEKGIREADGVWSHAIRLILQCCEYNITIQTSVKLPWSCCEEPGYLNCTASDLFTKDCNQTILTWLDHYETAIYTSLAVLHILLASCSLIRRSRVTSRSGS